MTILSNNLKKIRGVLMMTGEEMAKKLGVTRASINHYESGISEPKAKHLRKLSILSGLSIDDIVSKTLVLRSNKNE